MDTNQTLNKSNYKLEMNLDKQNYLKWKLAGND